MSFYCVILVDIRELDFCIFIHLSRKVKKKNENGCGGVIGNVRSPATTNRTEARFRRERRGKHIAPGLDAAQTYRAASDSYL